VTVKYNQVKGVTYFMAVTNGGNVIGRG